MLGQLLSMRRDHGAANLYSGVCRGGATRRTCGICRRSGSSELIDALNILQQDFSVEAPVSRAEVQQLQTEMLITSGGSSTWGRTTRRPSVSIRSTRT